MIFEREINSVNIFSHRICSSKKFAKELILYICEFLLLSMVIAGEMMWLTGSNNTNPCGNYGEKGKGNTTNVPGGRHSFASWIDSFNNLYLFGGVGYTHSAGPGKRAFIAGFLFMKII